MLTPDWFKGKKITVMGLGLHGGGLGAAVWLMRRGAQVTVTDLKDQHALASSIASLERAFLVARAKLGKTAVHPVRYVLGRHDDADFTGSDLVIQNPGVPREHPLLALAAKSGVPIDTDIGIFFQLCPFPITAVSGTKGKTTTTALVAAMSKAHDKRTVIGGNIRVSALEALDRLLKMSRKKPCPVVLELSSWQLEGLERHRLSPHVGALTNIKEDHLNRYRDMDDYSAAKEIIVRFQKEGDMATLNAEDPRLAKFGKKLRHPAFWFSKRSHGRDGAFVRDGAVVLRTGGKLVRVCEVSDIRLPGAHNLENVLAAVCTAAASGVPVRLMRPVIRAFDGVPGRTEIVALKSGATFVNDTTATTPDAVLAALDAFKKKKGRIILIGGGSDKNLKFDSWAEAVKKNVKHLVLFDGNATVKMETALTAAGFNRPIVGARSMREAVTEAVRHVKKGDLVLLSPGCASFGLFVNEFDRGDQFVREVKKLKE